MSRSPEWGDISPRNVQVVSLNDFAYSRTSQPVRLYGSHHFPFTLALGLRSAATFATAVFLTGFFAASQ